MVRIWWNPAWVVENDKLQFLKGDLARMEIDFDSVLRLTGDKSSSAFFERRRRFQGIVTCPFLKPVVIRVIQETVGYFIKNEKYSSNYFFHLSWDNSLPRPPRNGRIERWDEKFRATKRKSDCSTFKREPLTVSYCSLKLNSF